MPELPEVETIKLGLSKKIVGLKISKIQIISPKSFIGSTKKVEGQKVLKIWRRAKILGIDLSSSLRDHKVAKQSKSEIATSPSAPRNDSDITLLIHLKMSGQIIYVPNYKRLTINNERFVGGHPTSDMLGKLPNSHTRVIFTFSDPLRPRSEASGSKLYFNDQRRFGWVRVVNSSSLIDNSSLKNLGPEPLEKSFTWQILRNNLLKHKSQPVKVAIMDQSIVAGVGNIYASEACFNAGLDPRTKVSQLTDKDMKSLHRGVLKALRAGIKHGGATRAHFVDPEGRKGYFLDYAKVYWKNGKPCPNCRTEIKKITLGGRGTYFCPKCQV